MPLKHGLLGLLNYESRTGYGLSNIFKLSLNFFWKAQTSQIYRELNKMEKEGWLTSEVVIQLDRPNKKVYSITDAGKEELNSWLHSNESLEWITLRSEFLMKLFFAGEKGLESNIEYMQQYRNKCLDSMLALEATGKIIANKTSKLDDPQKALYWSLTSEFGYDYYEMCLKWADKVIKKMEERIK